jgi:hypothetical protein
MIQLVSGRTNIFFQKDADLYLLQRCRFYKPRI